MKEYDHIKIEQKWQKKWESSKPNKAKENTKKKKFYALIEFPYPSGDGLHVGHIRSNTAMDIISRKRRREGYEVLYPIGWDAFGLPTENYAIKTGIQPAIVTKKNTDTFRRQLKALGFSFDWTREVDTTDPKYYKWTQWIFLQFLKRGLAYKKKMTINWCPKDLIGLANEEVIDGCCERCGTKVEQKEKEQWMLAITKYADRLDKDLDETEFLEKIKIQQRNWIGKSEGAEIEFTFKKDVNFVLLHGWEGSPQRDFFPWLKSELEKRGYSVQVPALPNPNNPIAEKQADYVLKNCQFDEKTILLGHSFGATVAMKVLEKLNKPIDTLVLAAGFIENRFKDGSAFDQEAHDWKYDFKKIKNNTQYVVALRDINDPVVLDDQASKIVKELGGVEIPFTAEDGHITGDKEPFLLSVLLPGIKVFTTRPDTLFGVTYIVLAPEHYKVSEFLPYIKNKSEVEGYIKQAQSKSQIDRTDIKKEKTGIKLEGVSVINPANNEEIPVWIADYVLADYGTGAVMAVPAHDERDWDFAKKYGLKIQEVLEPVYEQSTEPGKIRPELPFDHRNAIIAIVKHWNEEKYIGLKWNEVAWGTLITGGVEEGQTPEEACKMEIREETGYLNPELVSDFGLIHGKFYHVPKKVNRFAHSHTMFFKLKDGAQAEVDEKEKKMHEVKWLTAKELEAFLTADSHKHALRILMGMQGAYTGDGILKNSGKFNGKESNQIKKEITSSVGGTWVTKFKLRDWVFSRQRYWGEPIPVVHCEKCGIVPVPEKDLPVKLPKVKNYAPTQTGESPLAAIESWVNTKCPQCKGKAKRETDTMPNWAGSSWYYLRYADPKNKKAFADKKKLEYWTPVDWYNGGMEHTTLHLLYSRFWHKFLFDLGLVPTNEPYKKRTSHGLILAEGGEKMSKSKGNVINPDSLVKTIGADALRIHEMFMGPFDQAIAWDTNSIAGSRRFIERVWKLQGKLGDSTNQKLDTLVHKTIKKVSEDIEAMRFNTAISAMMILLNELEKETKISKEHYLILIQLLAPFAPHIAEELWALIGNKGSIHSSGWPKYDDTKLVDETVNIMVQVNGKVRGSVVASADASEDDVKNMARNKPEINKWVENNPIKKVIFVKGKIINFIV